MEDKLLEPGELAVRWGVTTRTLGIWRRKGMGPAYLQVGRTVRYQLSDVEKWEQEVRQRTAE